MIKRIGFPHWLYVMESLYRNRITLLNDRFEDETSIAYICRDLKNHGLEISYNHLLRVLKLLVQHELVTREKINREVIHTLTEKGNNFIKKIDFSIVK